MTLKNQEKNQSQQLFNQIQKPIAIGQHHPNIQTIKETLIEGSLIALFCYGCGYTQGVDQEGLDFITKETNLDLPKNLSDKIITVDHCNLCDENLENLKIETIQI